MEAGTGKCSAFLLSEQFSIVEILAASFLLINEEIYWQIISALLNRTLFCNGVPKYPDVLQPVSH